MESHLSRAHRALRQKVGFATTLSPVPTFRRESEYAGQPANPRYVPPPMAARTHFCWQRLAFAGFLVCGAAYAEPPAKTATISVNVGPLRSTKGSLACRLHSSAEGFPRSGTGLITVRVKITGGSARCVFENVLPGTYAIVVHHDENDNHQCDKNPLGMPIEGYGVSNNRTYALSAPKWRESKFDLESGQDRTLSISLRY